MPIAYTPTVGKPYLRRFRAEFRASNRKNFSREIVAHLIAYLPRTSFLPFWPIISTTSTTIVAHLTAHLIAYLTPT